MYRTRIAVALAALIALPALGALGTYAIDLRRELRDVDVAITATNGPNAIVTMLNLATGPAVCRVDFEGGKVIPTRRTVLIPPSGTASAEIKVADESLEKLTVLASCEKQDPNLRVPTS